MTEVYFRVFMVGKGKGTARRFKRVSESATYVLNISVTQKNNGKVQE